MHETAKKRRMDLGKDNDTVKDDVAARGCAAERCGNLAAI
jgi:hypothetical protein